MPFPFPTPAEAAAARDNGGVFNTIGHNLLTHSPYLGPLYNLAGTVSHLISGTAGQYGPAPTLIGRLLQAINPQGQQPANLALPRSDADYGNPNYIGLGTPTQPAQGPLAPDQSQSNPLASVFQRLGITGQPAQGPPISPSIDPLHALLSYMQGTTAGGGGGSPLQALGALRNSNLNIPGQVNYTNPQAQDPNYFTNHFGGFITPSAFIGGGSAGGGPGGPGRSAGFLVQ